MEIRWARGRAKRRLGRTYATVKPAEGAMMSETEEGEAKNFCKGFAASGPWAVRSRAASGDQSVLRRS
jgi:hypothetical protein